ncbi:GNAT family N-acetyltransferase [Lysinibacillus cavernae]|uniref:GNAT family N-acetyltransferase n=1 Tax=Lysinibacillus cavernae TaxID=2666135 RepID=UPI0012D9762B|nr:GNAT family N-acetyltransferase [Lysinibacillus cavernae]
MKTVIISICAATNEDYLAVNDLVREGHEEHVSEEPTVFKSVETVMPESYFNELLEDNNSHIFVAKSSELVVGFAVMSIETSPPFQSLVQRKYAYIHDFGVKKEIQKQGIGKLLFEHCKEWAIASGAASIQLNVWEFNTKAIEFYEHIGMGSISRKMKINM